MTCADYASTDSSNANQAPTATPSPPKASASPSSTPSFAPDCWCRCSTPINLLRPFSSTVLSALSSAASMTTWRTLDSGQQPETCHKIQRAQDQEDLVASSATAAASLPKARVNKRPRPAAHTPG